MHSALLFVAAMPWLLPVSLRDVDPGDPRFASTYVKAKASIEVEIKGIVQFNKGVRPVLEVHELHGPPSQVWQLDIGQDEKLKELLARLDGKLAVVTGTCGLRTVGIAVTAREPFGLNQIVERRVTRTAIDFDRKLAVTSVKEIGNK